MYMHFNFFLKIWLDHRLRSGPPLNKSPIQIMDLNSSISSLDPPATALSVGSYFYYKIKCVIN